MGRLLRARHLAILLAAVWAFLTARVYTIPFSLALWVLSVKYLFIRFAIFSVADIYLVTLEFQITSNVNRSGE